MSLFDSSNKGVKFATIGDEITGTVSGAPYERQQTKFGTQEPDFWPDSTPKMQILVPLQTALREDPNDNGERTLYVASKHMKRAISDAIRNAGATDILPGGVLTVKYIGNAPDSKNPANPAKMYAAQYTAPTSAFAAQPAAPVQQAPQQAFVPTTAAVQPQQAPQAVPQPVQQAPFAPAPPQPHPSGLTQDQIGKLGQLRAAGITDDVIANAIGATPQQLATYDATPF